MNLMEYPDRQAALIAVFEAVTGEKCKSDSLWGSVCSVDGVEFRLDIVYEGWARDPKPKGYTRLKLSERWGKAWRSVNIAHNQLDLEKAKVKFQELKSIAVKNQAWKERERQESVVLQRQRTDAREESKQLNKALGLDNQVEVVLTGKSKAYKLTLLLKDETEVRKLVTRYQDENMG